MTSPKRRIEKDVMELMMSDHDVTLIDDSIQQFLLFSMDHQTLPTKEAFGKLEWSYLINIL